jgi:hypothetical protein
MTIDNFAIQLSQSPDSIEFEQTMQLIEEHFEYQPSRFSNGPEVDNAAGSNEGSCKIFALGKLLSLSEAQTLACFGKFYREEVLQQPEANNHANIRAFMTHGWPGIQFDRIPLQPK